MRARRSRVETLGAQLGYALLSLGVHGTRHSASLSRSIRILLAGLARHAQGRLVFLVVPAAPRFVTFARPMAWLAYNTFDKFALLTAESAHLLSLILLIAVQSRMLLFVARLTVTIVTALSLRFLFATLGLMISFAILYRLNSTRTTNQCPTAGQIERQPKHVEYTHR